MTKRLVEIRRQHGFDAVAYEWPDRPRHPRTRADFGREYSAAFGLGMARLMVLAAFLRLEAPAIPLLAVGQSAIKECVTRNPEASKSQVRTWLERSHGWDLGRYQDDEVDALALGVTVHRRQLLDTARPLPRPE